jgi:hypothetical protein
MKKLFVGTVLSVIVMVAPAMARPHHNPAPETLVTALEMPVIVRVMRALDEKYNAPERSSVSFSYWRAHDGGIERWLSEDTSMSLYWNGQYSVQKNVATFGVKWETLEKGNWEDLLR